VLLTLLLLGAAPAPQEADPLAQARDGRVRCVAPDTRARTCASMTRYVPRADGSFDALVSGMVLRDPLVVLDYRTSGTVEDGAVCSVVRPVDIRDGKLSREGAPLAPALQADVAARVAAAVQPLAGRKRCYRDRFDGETYQSAVTIDGLLRPELSQRAIWVRPDDGYAVGG
jgi:hypothetical protein